MIHDGWKGRFNTYHKCLASNSHVLLFVLRASQNDLAWAKVSDPEL
jgi:hypothetical protein